MREKSKSFRKPMIILYALFGMVLLGMNAYLMYGISLEISNFNPVNVERGDLSSHSSTVKLHGYIAPIEGIEYIGKPGFLKENIVTRTGVAGNLIFPATYEILRPFILKSGAREVVVENTGRSLRLESLGNEVYIAGKFNNQKFNPTFMAPAEKIGLMDVLPQITSLLLGIFFSTLLFTLAWEKYTDKKVITKRREKIIVLIILVLGALAIYLA